MNKIQWTSRCLLSDKLLSHKNLSLERNGTISELYVNQAEHFFEEMHTPIDVQKEHGWEYENLFVGLILRLSAGKK